MDIEDKKLYSDKWFSYLQAQICDHFEKIEKDSKSSKKFISTNWSKKNNGGGGTGPSGGSFNAGGGAGAGGNGNDGGYPGGTYSDGGIGVVIVRYAG